MFLFDDSLTKPLQGQLYLFDQFFEFMMEGNYFVSMTSSSQMKKAEILLVRWEIR